MPADFRNRAAELDMLRRRWESGEAQIFTLWGRRRVGKSLLLVVLPSQGRLIDPAGARRHLEGRVLPALDQFISPPAFEEVCQRWLLGATDAAAVGWWWGTVREMRDAALRGVDRELDAAAVDDEGRVIAIGSCKWTAGPLPFSEKTKLDALAGHLAGGGEPPELYFFSRGGFEEQLIAAAEREARVHLIASADLWPPGASV